MTEESGFSVITRSVETVSSLPQNETAAPAAEPKAPQLDEVASILEDRVATGDVLVEARDAAEQYEEEAYAPAAQTPDADDEEEEPEASPKAKKLKKKDYEKQLIERHLDWRELERKVQRDGLKIVVLFEGRDTGKRGGVVNRITDFADARICRIARIDALAGRERTQWFFQPYVAHLPAAGEIVLFDGSWYGRAALDRVTGKSTEADLEEKLSACAEFESMLCRSGIAIFKCWLSADESGKDLAAGLEMLGKRWNVDPKDFDADVDLAGVREQILATTDGAPWHIVEGRDKRSVRVDAIRAIVSAFVEERKPSIATGAAEIPASCGPAADV